MLGRASVGFDAAVAGSALSTGVTSRLVASGDGVHPGNEHGAAGFERRLRCQRARLPDRSRGKDLQARVP